jgi:hypothetical protein
MTELIVTHFFAERAHGATDKHTCDLAYNLGNMYEAQEDWEKVGISFVHVSHCYKVLYDLCRHLRCTSTPLPGTPKRWVW